MDLEALSTVTVDTEAAKGIAQECNKLIETQKEVANMEEQIKKLKETERNLSEQSIPNLMQQAGISEIKLDDGTAISIKTYYAASISKANEDEAFNWLRDNGFGDLIKNNVILQFGKAQDEDANSLVSDLKSKGHSVSQKMKVEPQTLKKFLREEIEAGKNVPADLFGVFVGNRTTIKRK
tara:strand:+ start:3780 stop:4319 length:540 start_codon:yes stop_codon:yes gene_type:complete